MFRQLQLKYKLILLFLVMALIVAGTGIFGLWNQERISTLLDLQKTSAAQEKLAVLMKVTLQGGRVNLLEASMTGTRGDDFENAKIDYELKRDSFNSYCKILLKGHPKLHIPPAGEGSMLAQRVVKVREAFQAFDKVAVKILDTKQALLDGGADYKSLFELTRNELPQVVDAASNSVDDLLVEVNSLAAQNEKAGQAIRQRSQVTLVSVICGAILLAIVLGLLATRSIVGRIQLLVRSLRQGAEGDLTATVQLAADDELGQLGEDFNQMLIKLSAMMGRVKHSSEELGQVGHRIQLVSRDVIATAEVQQKGIDETSEAILRINDSQQGINDAVEVLSRSADDTSTSILNMAKSIQGVAHNTESLATSVTQVSSAIGEMDATTRQIEQNANDLKQASLSTASSVAEMDASIQQVEQNAQQAAKVSASVHQDANAGQQSVQATIKGIQEIRRSSLAASESITMLSQSVSDIGLILQVINDVTEETRLLSLNASIIAAQSGEHGKGFAVVADEIRKLAERTNASTEEIDQLISRVREETERAVQAIQGAEKRVAEGEALSQKSGEALREIVAGVEEAAGSVNDIARATREQARGSLSIRETMEQVADMVSQIAVSTHQQAKASEQIMAEVEKMSTLTVQVRDATKKQNADGGLISRLTEEIGAKIQQIRQACADQAQGGRQIVDAVADIQKSTRDNLQSAKVMGESLDSLSRQITSLEEDVTEFRILDQEVPAIEAPAEAAEDGPPGLPQRLG